MNGRRAARTAVVAVRAGWGLALLVSPRAITAAVHHAPPGRRTGAVARVLGLRHLAQAVVVGLLPARDVQLAGGAVDVTHATSMVALAAVSPAHRRAGLTDASIGAVFAVASAVVA